MLTVLGIGAPEYRARPGALSLERPSRDQVDQTLLQAFLQAFLQALLEQTHLHRPLGDGGQESQVRAIKIDSGPFRDTDQREAFQPERLAGRKVDALETGA